MPRPYQSALIESLDELVQLIDVQDRLLSQVSGGGALSADDLVRVLSSNRQTLGLVARKALRLARSHDVV